LKIKVSGAVIAIHNSEFTGASGFKGWRNKLPYKQLSHQPNPVIAKLMLLQTEFPPSRE